MNSKNAKAGIFVFITLIVLFAIILRISQGRLFFGGDYTVYMDVDSAVGLARNTPVQIAGVDVGIVKAIRLAGSSHARLVLSIENGVMISTDAVGRIKTTGILGDAFIEIYQKDPIAQEIQDEGVIKNVEIHGDLSSITNEFSTIAHDVKAITSQMKKVMAGDDSPFDKTMKNLEKITDSVASLALKNEKNIDAIIANLKLVSQNMNYMVQKGMPHINNAFANIDDVTMGLAEGQGTIGKLLKDDTTVEKLNDTLDSVSSALGGFNKLKFDLGAHTEFLGGTSNFKNYVALAIQPRPDKSFLFEAVSDPDPSFTTVTEDTIVTSGGTTSTVTTERRTKNLNKFLFSAQIAKKFEDFTIRGGLIESSGGVGLDYDQGPLGLKFSAFDFKTDRGQKPHLKFMGTTQLTKTLYLLGGIDDFINRNQSLDWFFGAGIRFTDDDLKSVLGLISAGAR